MIPSLSAEQQRAGTVRWLSRTMPILAGPSLGEMAMFGRGWQDDFLGDLLRDEYDAQTAGGASTVALVGGEHGGVVRCTADTADGNYGIIILGNLAGGYDSLDVDSGWVIAWKMRANQLTNIQATAGVYEWAATDFTYAGLRTDIFANNWMIRSTADGIAFTNLDTGVAADTDWHWHSLAAYDVVGTTTIGYWVDGALLGEITTNISGNPMEATMFCVNRGGAASARTTDFDYWTVKPR